MITFPAEALANEGEDGAKATPSVGDKVTLPNVVGTVKSTDAKNISVDIETINDMPATSDGAAPADAQDPHAQMEKLANEADAAQ